MKEQYVIGVHGVPRSGTSWLGQLINASPYVNFKFQPLFSYRFQKYLNLNSTCEEVNNFLSEVSVSDDAFINLKDESLLGSYPVFNKSDVTTHLVFKHVRYHYLIETILNCRKDAKFILIVRNPLEVLNSWRKAPREFYPEWDFNEEWLEANKKNSEREGEYFGYAKWKEATILYHDLKQKYEDQIKIVDYNYLRENTLESISDIYRFINLELDIQTEDFIKQSRNKKDNHPNSVYKSSEKRVSYKDEIPQHIQDYIFNDLKHSNLSYLLDDA